jgi:hypothetical protein
MHFRRHMSAVPKTLVVSLLNCLIKKKKKRKTKYNIDIYQQLTLSSLSLSFFFIYLVSFRYYPGHVTNQLNKREKEKARQKTEEEFSFYLFQLLSFYKHTKMRTTRSTSNEPSSWSTTTTTTSIGGGLAMLASAVVAEKEQEGVLPPKNEHYTTTALRPYSRGILSNNNKSAGTSTSSMARASSNHHHNNTTSTSTKQDKASIKREQTRLRMQRWRSKKKAEALLAKAEGTITGKTSSLKNKSAGNNSNKRKLKNDQRRESYASSCTDASDSSVPCPKRMNRGLSVDTYTSYSTGVSSSVPISPTSSSSSSGNGNGAGMHSSLSSSTMSCNLVPFPIMTNSITPSATNTGSSTPPLLSVVQQQQQQQQQPMLQQPIYVPNVPMNLSLPPTTSTTTSNNTSSSSNNNNTSSLLLQSLVHGNPNSLLFGQPPPSSQVSQFGVSSLLPYLTGFQNGTNIMNGNNLPVNMINHSSTMPLYNMYSPQLLIPQQQQQLLGNLYPVNAHSTLLPSHVRGPTLTELETNLQQLLRPAW